MRHAECLLLNATAGKRPKCLRLPQGQTAHTEIKKETGCKGAPWDAGTADHETLGVSPLQGNAWKVCPWWQGRALRFLTLPGEFRTLLHPKDTSGRVGVHSRGTQDVSGCSIGPAQGTNGLGRSMELNIWPQLAAGLSPLCCSITADLLTLLLSAVTH